MISLFSLLLIFFQKLAKKGLNLMSSNNLIINRVIDNFNNDQLYME